MPGHVLDEVADPKQWWSDVKQAWLRREAWKRSPDSLAAYATKRARQQWVQLPDRYEGPEHAKVKIRHKEEHPSGASGLGPSGLGPSGTCGLGPIQDNAKAKIQDKDG